MKELLDKLRKRVKKGWVQGAFKTDDGSCLMGHLRDLVKDEERVDGSPYKDVLVHIVEQYGMTEHEVHDVQQVVFEVLGEMGSELQFLEASVVMINEKRCMEKSDILDLLERP